MSECENRRFSASVACMSHLLHSECVSACLTVTALTVNYTVCANCLSYWKHGPLCIQYADGTRIIVVSLSLMLWEGKKTREEGKKEWKKLKKERSDTIQTVTWVSPLWVLDAGVCLVSQAVLSLCGMLNKDTHMHTKTSLCSPVKTWRRSLCVLLRTKSSSFEWIHKVSGCLQMPQKALCPMLKLCVWFIFSYVGS